MKKASIFSKGIIMSTTFLFFMACHKPGGLDPDTPHCRIQSINYDGYGGPNTVTFSYNMDGNPVSAFFDHAFDEQLNYYWRYDGAGRLTDMVLIYNRDTTTFSHPEAWYKFYYDQKGNIVLDTTILSPDIVNGRPTGSHFGNYQIHNYEYDNQHRLTRDISSGYSTTFGARTILDTHYSYGPDGNRTGRTYDNKVSLFSTNRIIQFLAKDYSRNNPVGGDPIGDLSWTYNAQRLPITLSHTPDIINPYEFFHIDAYRGIGADTATIHWTCEPPASPGGHGY